MIFKSKMSTSLAALAVVAMLTLCAFTVMSDTDNSNAEEENKIVVDDIFSSVLSSTLNLNSIPTPGDDDLQITADTTITEDKVVSGNIYLGANLVINDGVTLTAENLYVTGNSSILTNSTGELRLDSYASVYLGDYEFYDGDDYYGGDYVSVKASSIVKFEVSNTNTLVDSDGKFVSSSDMRYVNDAKIDIGSSPFVVLNVYNTKDNSTTDYGYFTLTYDYGRTITDGINVVSDTHYLTSVDVTKFYQEMQKDFNGKTVSEILQAAYDYASNGYVLPEIQYSISGSYKLVSNKASESSSIYSNGNSNKSDSKEEETTSYDNVDIGIYVNKDGKIASVSIGYGSYSKISEDVSNGENSYNSETSKHVDKTSEKIDYSSISATADVTAGKGTATFSIGSFKDSYEYDYESTGYAHTKIKESAIDNLKATFEGGSSNVVDFIGMLSKLTEWDLGSINQAIDDSKLLVNAKVHFELGEYSNSSKSNYDYGNEIETESDSQVVKSLSVDASMDNTVADAEIVLGNLSITNADKDSYSEYPEDDNESEIGMNVAGVDAKVEANANKLLDLIVDMYLYSNGVTDDGSIDVISALLDKEGIEASLDVTTFDYNLTYTGDDYTRVVKTGFTGTSDEPGLKIAFGTEATYSVDPLSATAKATASVAMGKDAEGNFSFHYTTDKKQNALEIEFDSLDIAVTNASVSIDQSDDGKWSDPMQFVYDKLALEGSVLADATVNFWTQDDNDNGLCQYNVYEVDDANLTLSTALLKSLCESEGSIEVKADQVSVEYGETDKLSSKYSTIDDVRGACAASDIQKVSGSMFDLVIDLDDISKCSVSLSDAVIDGKEIYATDSVQSVGKLVLADFTKYDDGTANLEGFAVPLTIKAIKITPKAEGNTASITYEIDGGKVEVADDTVIGLIDQLSGDNKVLDVKLDNAADDTVSIKMSNAALTKLKDSSASLKISGTAATVELDSDFVKKVAGKGDGDFKVVYNTVEKNQLSDDQKKVLDDKGVSFIFTIDAYNGDTAIHDNGGKATITFPYTPVDTSKKITAYFLNDKNELEAVSCSYADGKVTITTDHFSTYTISEEVASSGSGNDNMLLYVAIIIVAILVVCVAAVAVKKRHA